MPRTEVQEAKVWMANLLKTDVQLAAVFGNGELSKVYVDQGYRGLGFPYILITYMSGADKNALGTTREMTVANFQVRIVTEGPPTDTDRTAESRMDFLLQHAVSQPSGGYLFSCRRVSVIDRPEYDGNKQIRYQNCGGMYRVWISKAP